MTRFVDGPAAGETLFLKRAPVFLRVVYKFVPGGVEVDALDLLTDTPSPGETVIAYRRVGRPGWMHLNRGRKGSGCFTVAEYRVVEAQPPADVLADATLWRAWCLANVEAAAPAAGATGPAAVRARSDEIPGETSPV